MIDHNTLLIIVDNFKREICECPELIDKANRIVVFDHHRKSAVSIDNPVLVYHEPYASSTSELVTEMLQYINRDFKLSEVEADALLAGIMVDTKNFAFKTGIKTFETAAFLKRKGADSIRVKLLFQSSFENYVAKTEIVKKAKKYRDNIAISVCDEKIENPVLMAAVASDEMLNIYGIEASFVLCAMNDRISVSARSLGNINVQIIMEKLGGGGHQAVSAAQIKKCTMEEALEKVHKAIDEYFEEEK
ncbi:MAG: DHH family phosphoesterase, partial [Firmicutes bacterium]|nr:DHH family phosphoesterase [Bacillota bacterium]